MTIQEPDLFWENMLGALAVLAGDPDTSRHTKFDPQTAPPASGPCATKERAILALLLSAFGTLAPQLTEAWTTREEQWLQWMQQVRDGPTIQLSKLTKKLEESIRNFGETTPLEREAIMRTWLA